MSLKYWRYEGLIDRQHRDLLRLCAFGGEPAPGPSGPRTERLISYYGQDHAWPQSRLFEKKR